MHPRPRRPARFRRGSWRQWQGCWRRWSASLRRFSPLACSNLGGRIARLLGLLLAVSRIAERNLSDVLPRLDAASRRRIIDGVRDDLGRNVLAPPHLVWFARTAPGPGREVDGERHLVALRDSDLPALLFSGHLGNREMVLPIGAALGITVSGFCRASSNPEVDQAIQALRPGGLGNGSMLVKGDLGARRLVASRSRRLARRPGRPEDE